MSSVIDALSSTMNSQQAKTLSAADDMSQNFLTLFLAQLKNQDPLNPLDNADMTSQLAQINVVSGLEKLNETMNTLLASYGEALSLQAANLIGKNVLVPGNQMVLTENGALFGAELEGPADMMEVVIKDATGKEVRRQNLGAQDAGAQAFYWDGTDMNGEVLEPGYYSFSIAASLGDSPVLNKTMQVGTVSALVRSNNGGFKLDVAGLGNVNLSDVRQVF